jgi:hypothetical protein
MSKVFNISTNLTNGAGLQRDYELLRRMLESYGHHVNPLMFNDYQQTVPPADVAICLEVINDKHLHRAKECWFVPNSEWYYPCWNGVLPRFHKILCKTKDALAIWSKKVGAAKCVYIGFESLDFYQPDVPRTPTFLHMAGKSETKNTKAVCDAWKNHSLPYPLTVVAFKKEIVACTRSGWTPQTLQKMTDDEVLKLPVLPNITHVVRMTDEEVARSMNENLFHIMPSKYEGFGHYIHEAIGCGGIVITTDAAPMKDFNGIHKSCLIPVQRKDVRLEAFFNIVDPGNVATVVNRVARTPRAEWDAYRQVARQAFLDDREAFRSKFREVAG